MHMFVARWSSLAVCCVLLVVCWLLFGDVRCLCVFVPFGVACRSLLLLFGVCCISLCVVDVCFFFVV